VSNLTICATDAILGLGFHDRFARGADWTISMLMVCLPGGIKSLSGSKPPLLLFLEMCWPLRLVGFWLFARQALARRVLLLRPVDWSFVAE